MTRHRSRRWTIAAALAVVALIAGVAVVVVANGSSGHRHLRLVNKAGGLSLTATSKPLLDEVATSLEGAFVAKHLNNIEIGVYSRTSAAREGVVVAGADAGGFTDARKQVQQYVGAQDQQAADNGFDPGTVATAVAYPAGPRAGQQACSTMALATTGIPVSVCAWVDQDTNGFAVSNTETPAQLAGTLAAMRVDMER